MADRKATPGGDIHNRTQMYRDDGDGTSSETRAANLWVWDTALLDFRKATVADLLASAASAETSSIYSGSTALTPKFKLANVAASQTDSAVVAAVSLKKLRVVGLVLVTGATATTVTFTSKPGGAGTAISMLFANAANGGAVLPFNPVGWFETAAGEGLSATTGAGSTTGIQVVYIEV